MDRRPLPCSSDPQYQNFGPIVGGKAQGRNGIVVWKANHVSVENLTACNFLGGTGDAEETLFAHDPGEDRTRGTVLAGPLEDEPDSIAPGDRG